MDIAHPKAWSLARHAKLEVEHVICNSCRADAPALLFENDSHGFGLHTVVCQCCGLVYLNPRPTQFLYEPLYSEQYEQLFPSAWSLSLAFEKAEKRITWYREYLASSNHLLEVGPGDGTFLHLTQSKFRSCTVLGLDPSPKAVEVCARRRLPVRFGYINQLSGMEQQFDSIAAFHILEHSTDPVTLLRQLHSLLQPEGCLLLEVPNILGSWMGLGMIHMAHPYQFSPNTLRRVLRQTGFAILELTILEEKLFESSIRVVARRSDAALEPTPSEPESDDIQSIKELFAQRLANWKLDLFRYRVKRKLLQTSPISSWKRHRFMRQLEQLTPAEFHSK